MDAGRRNNRGLRCEAQSQRPAGSVENQAECHLGGFPLSERRVSMGWTELGQFPPGDLSRGSKTSVPDKSSWVGPRSLLEQGG